MASITRQTISGDLEVSRNMVTGGQLSVTGKAEFGGRVTVKGFLDAPNLKVPCKGMFESDTELRNAYPRPQNGWFAYTSFINDSEAEGGQRAPNDSDTESTLYWVFRAYNGKWIESGYDTIGVTTDVESLESQINDEGGIDDRLGALEDAVGDNDSGTGLTEQVETLQSQVKSLQTEVAALQSDTTGSADIEKLEKEIASKFDAEDGEALDKKIDGVAGDLQTLSSRVSAIAGDDGDDTELSLKSIDERLTLAIDGEWGGTTHFNGIQNLERSGVRLVEGTMPENGDEGYFAGVLWLEDRKIFVGVFAKVVVDCGKEYIVHEYYTDWSTAEYYMETPGEEGGLWKEKVYIHAGSVWVWNCCEGQIVKAGGSIDNPLTKEDIDRLFKDFEFVDVGQVLHRAFAKGEGLMELEAETVDDVIRIKGKTNIKGVTKEDVVTMFDTVDEEEAEEPDKE